MSLGGRGQIAQVGASLNVARGDLVVPGRGAPGESGLQSGSRIEGRRWPRAARRPALPCRPPPDGARHGQVGRGRAPARTRSGISLHGNLAALRDARRDRRTTMNGADPPMRPTRTLIPDGVEVTHTPRCGRRHRQCRSSNDLPAFGGDVPVIDVVTAPGVGGPRDETRCRPASVHTPRSLRSGSDPEPRSSRRDQRVPCAFVLVRLGVPHRPGRAVLRGGTGVV
jgi:hypothetical protein